MRKINFVVLFVLSILLVNCTAEDPQSCTVIQNEEGSATISCEDGTEATVADGADGCTMVDNDDGTYFVSCPDGTEITFVGGTVTPDATVIHGSYTVENQWDLDAIKNIEEITGDLTITGLGYSVVDLPNLKRVGRYLSINWTSIVYLKLLKLEQTYSFTISSNESLIDIELPIFTNSEQFIVTQNPLLSHCILLDLFEQVNCPLEHQSDNDETATCN